MVSSVVLVTYVIMGMGSSAHHALGMGLWVILIGMVLKRDSTVRQDDL